MFLNSFPKSTIQLRILNVLKHHCLCHNRDAALAVCYLVPFLGFLRKPKTRRSKRFLESRAPKLTEDVKNTMIMKGGNTSQTVTTALKDIVSCH